MTLQIGRVVIVEGIGLFHPEVAPYLDYRIWLDVDLDTATDRGIARELSLGHVQSPAWLAVWKPNEFDFEQHFRPRASADLLVTPVQRELTPAPLMS